MILLEYFFVSKHQHKAEFKNLNDSEVLIFQTLKPVQSHWPHWPLQPLQPQKAFFTKELPDSDDWIIPGTNSCPFLWNASSKIQFFTDLSIFSARSCWGQQMLLFWKLVHETQTSKPPEATRQHNSTKSMFLLLLTTTYFSSFQYETPCTSGP